jgi:hypothetical protein
MFFRLWGPCFGGWGTGINNMKRKRANSNNGTHSSVEILLFKGWLLKGQSPFLQLSNVGIEFKMQKRSCEKNVVVLLYIRQKNCLVSQAHKNRWLGG